ncbi:MAG: hypothetical protein RLZZ517_71 [Candidatus Parcubacteria bacterium]|jgi:hypothetical protein
MNTISTKGILDHEILSFKNYLNYKSEAHNQISSRIFWKLFYKKYKKFVWFHDGKIYKISTSPFEMYELNTERESIFLSRETLEKQTFKITILLILFILFILLRIPQDSLFVLEKYYPLSIWGLLLFVFISFKIPRLIYKFRFKILKK